MPKTKAQKIQEVKDVAGHLKGKETLIIADFTGLPVNEMTTFRKSIRAMGGMFHVMKKRLLKILLEQEGFTFDRETFPGQSGIIISPKDLSETAGTVYAFAKEKNKKEEIFKILGGFLLGEKKQLSGKEVKMIGALPSREVLLGQLVGMIASPLKKFLFVLNEKSKQA